AGCAYASFVSVEALEGARLERIAPLSHDPAEYAALIATDGRRIAPTVTCAANLLGVVPEGAFARGNAQAARRAFDLIAQALNADPLALARTVLTAGAEKLRHAIERLIADYSLDRESVAIVGGGGGAGALVPALAELTGLPYRIARDAEVIAPIGVALALV